MDKEVVPHTTGDSWESAALQILHKFVPDLQEVWGPLLLYHVDDSDVNLLLGKTSNVLAENNIQIDYPHIAVFFEWKALMHSNATFPFKNADEAIQLTTQLHIIIGVMLTVYSVYSCAHEWLIVRVTDQPKSTDHDLETKTDPKTDPKVNPLCTPANVIFIVGITILFAAKVGFNVRVFELYMEKTELFVIIVGFSVIWWIMGCIIALSEKTKSPEGSMVKFIWIGLGLGLVITEIYHITLFTSLVDTGHDKVVLLSKILQTIMICVAWGSFLTVTALLMVYGVHGKNPPHTQEQPSTDDKKSLVAHRDQDSLHPHVGHDTPDIQSIIPGDSRRTGNGAHGTQYNHAHGTKHNHAFWHIFIGLFLCSLSMYALAILHITPTYEDYKGLTMCITLTIVLVSFLYTGGIHLQIALIHDEKYANLDHVKALQIFTETLMFLLTAQYTYYTMYYTPYDTFLKHLTHQISIVFLILVPIIRALNVVITGILTKPVTVTEHDQGEKTDVNGGKDGDSKKDGDSEKDGEKGNVKMETPDMFCMEVLVYVCSLISGICIIIYGAQTRGENDVNRIMYNWFTDWVAHGIDATYTFGILLVYLTLSILTIISYHRYHNFNSITPH